MGGVYEIPENTFYFNLPSVHVDRMKHEDLSKIYSRFIHSTHENFGIGMEMHNGKIDFLITNDDVYSLKTIYMNLERNHIIGKMNRKSFKNMYISRFKNKGFIFPATKNIDFFEYLISYASWFPDINFIVYLNLEPYYSSTQSKVFKIRIYLMFEDDNYSDKLISLIESYWSSGENKIKMVDIKKINLFLKKYGLIEESAFTNIMPYPGEHISSLKRKNVIRENNLSIILGRDAVSESNINIHLKNNEGSTTLIIGETGSGKSTMLLNIFSQIKNYENPVIVLDPTGDIAKKMLYITDPKRTIFISPMETPVSMNIMKSAYDNIKYNAPKIAEDLIRILKDVTESESHVTGGLVGTKIEDIIRNSIAGLSEIPNTTILDIYDILVDERKRKMFYSISKNEDFKKFLLRIDGMDNEEIGSTRRVLSFIKTNTILKEMLCAKSPLLNFDDVFDKNMIVIVNGERPFVGENVTKFLLSFILTMVWITAQKKNKKCYILLDEIQDYSNSSLNEMITMGRKNNIEIFMATTHLSSLSDELIKSLMANVKNLVIFRTSPSDAREFSEKTNVEKKIFIEMDNGKAYFHSSYYSGIIKTENIKIEENDITEILNFSKMYVENEINRNPAIIYDIKFLENMNIEVSLEELKNLRINSKTGDEDKISEELRNYISDGTLELMKNKIVIKKDFPIDRRIEKLFSLGLLVRKVNENKLICYPYPGYGSMKFDHPVHVEFMDDNIMIDEEIYTEDDFYRIENDRSLLNMLEKIFGGFDGKTILVTSSRKISECLRKFYPELDEKYGNTLERAVKNELVRNGKAELIKAKIGKMTMRLLKLNIKNIPECEIYIENSEKVQ